MSPIGPSHEVVVDRLAKWSFLNLPLDRVCVRIQNSIGIPALDSAPEPDVAWVNERDYSKGRPKGEDVPLIVEVAESSLAYDRGEKARLYAAAGIAEYWIVNLIDKQIEVRRQPDYGRYRDLTVFSIGQEVRPRNFQERAIPVSRVFDEPSSG
jgi:Uma2 family endonuclease